MSAEATSDLWWKNAVVYCVDVQSFQDANGDGIGDLDGLTKRIDYLAGLGVTCLWLMPFFPSPERDYGYDVADYYGVAPKYGTLGDMVELLRTARDRGIRVIADLVVNHTSVEHPWFQAARRNRDGPYHDYYVWADRKPTDAADGVIFPGKQHTTRSYDEARAAAFERWRANTLGSEVSTSLSQPAQLASAAKHVRPEDMDSAVRISSDLGRHVEWIRRDFDRGFDAVFLHEVGPEQERFVEVFGQDVLPRLR